MEIRSSSVEALRDIGNSMSETAHDIANITTDNLEARYGRADGDNTGQDVMAQDIRNTPEPVEESSNVPLFAQNGHVMDAVPAREGLESDQTADMVHMMNLETAFSANVKAITAQDEMIGMIMDLRA
ncbi:MAG: flagellar basal body rod C-terminal domain-containing protein [Desulfovibrio sp.]